MPPSDPLRQQVLEAIQTKLRAIVAGALYFNTVKSTSVVLEGNANLMTMPHTEDPYFIVEPTPEGSRFYMPAMRMKNNFQVSITARNHAPGGTGLSRKMETWEQLLADIEVALTRDITLGGLVIDVRLLEPTPGYDLNQQSPMVMVVQPLICTLIRTYGSP